MSVEVVVTDGPHDPGGGCDGDFVETGPRPPIPGKSSPPPPAKAEGNVESRRVVSNGPLAGYQLKELMPSGVFVDNPKHANWPYVPLKSSSDRCRDGDADGTDMPFGFGAGSACEGEFGDRGAGTPSYLRWAVSLNYLLDDSEGVALFKRFLQQEKCEDSLDFWFACKGLKRKSVDQADEIRQLIRVIYRRYLRTLTGISAATRQQITDKINSKTDLTQNIFDAAQEEVEKLINETTYPNFLKSDIYLQCVQMMQSGSGELESPKLLSGQTSRSSSCGRPDLGILPTVMEDCELALPVDGNGTAMSSSVVAATPTTVATLSLTSKHLLVTQRYRAYSELRRPEAYAGHYLQQNQSSRTLNPYHAMYSSYVPASAQDSELQSLSSDAHTDDTVSQTDSSVDGVPAYNSRKYLKQQNRAMRQNANQNKDMSHAVIPRTLRPPQDQISPNETQKFAAVLIQKLQEVQQYQESQERVDESLRKMELLEERKMPPPPKPQDPETQQAIFKAILQEKMMPAGVVGYTCDSDQSILDEHVSRIWNDQTPSRSPPEHRRSGTIPSGTYPPPGTVPGARHRDHHHHHGPKSGKSGSANAEHADTLDSQRRTKRGDISHQLPQGPNSNERVMFWMLDSEKYSGGHSADSEKDSSSRHKNKTRSNLSATSVVSKREGRGKKQTYNSSRSDSLERGHSLMPMQAQPSQPFMTDPSMPILPQPNTTTQLEEARRRLEDDSKAKAAKLKFGSGSKEKFHQDASKSLTRSASSKGMPSGAAEFQDYSRRDSKKYVPSVASSVTDSSDYTVVGYFFGTDSVPIRTKLPGKNITLKQFKSLISKKGNYRYLFKLATNEFGTGFVNQEITDDNEIVPLWEGKIVARVDVIDS